MSYVDDMLKKGVDFVKWSAHDLNKAPPKDFFSNRGDIQKNLNEVKQKLGEKYSEMYADMGLQRLASSVLAVDAPSLQLTAKWNKEVKENKLSFKEVPSRLAAVAARIPPVGWFWGSLSSTNFKVKFRAAQQCWERLTE